VSSGAIHLDGEDVTQLPAHERARRGLGYVPQGRMIFADLTVEENLLIGADLNRANGRALLEEVLAEFPMLEMRYRQRGDTLSGGEQQMLALGRALAGGPRCSSWTSPPRASSRASSRRSRPRSRRSAGGAGSPSSSSSRTSSSRQPSLGESYVMEKGRIAREISPENVMDEDIVRDYLAV
jgi:branched-chain amino acid transport system ATP-binding protein